MPPSAATAIYLGPAAIDPPVVQLPLATARAQLGFPSPAEDYLDDTLDLNHVLVRNAPATFLYRAAGMSMLKYGICDADLLVVDRSLQPVDGDIVIAIWDGQEPVCKKLEVHADHICLVSGEPPIKLGPETEVEIFVVWSVARQIQRRRTRVCTR